MTTSNSTDGNLDKTRSDRVKSQVSPWMARLVYPLGCYVLLPLYFGRIQVVGQENIPKKEPTIVAPTHRSRWDALLVPYAVGRWVSGRDLHFMVSANEVQKGLQGWIIRRMGGFPVDTERPRPGSLRHSVELLLDNRMVVIFPEGNIFRERQIHPLKRGLARIAIEAESLQPDSKLKILPVEIHYSQPYPQWGTDVTVTIGKPLTVGDYQDASPRKRSQDLTAALTASLQALQTEREPDQPELVAAN